MDVGPFIEVSFPSLEERESMTILHCPHEVPAAQDVSSWQGKSTCNRAGQEKSCSDLWILFLCRFFSFRLAGHMSFFGAAQEKTKPTPPALFKILHRPSFEFNHSNKVIFQLLVDFIFLGLKERIQHHVLHCPKPTHALEMILSFPYFQTCRTAVNIFGARCARVHLSELALERLHSSRNSDPF